MVFSKGLSEVARKRVELAVAVGQEKLLAAHVDHALDLIALVDDQVGFTDALEIYSRLLRLDEDEAQNISTRSLAILGEKAGDRAAWPEPRPAPEPEREDGGREGNGRSLFGNLRNRLRGRVNEELRRKIEFIAARTEVALIRTHVENAMQFVGILKEEMEEKEAVELYLDALDVRESVAEVTYYLTLSRIADQFLPSHGSGLAAARGEAGLPPHADVAGPLHAVE
jgi:PAS domain-containing protein